MTSEVLVVDASVIVAAALAEGGLGPLVGHRLVAPPLIRSEATSVVRELSFRKQIPPNEGRDAVARVQELPLRIERPTGLGLRAYDTAVRLGWAKTYVAEYVALAAGLGVPLVTLDARLRRGAERLVRTLDPRDVHSS